MSDHEQCENTDREIWRGSDKGNGSYYADSIHMTKEGALGINCGGHVVVMPIREWHRLGSIGRMPLPDAPSDEKSMEEQIKLAAARASIQNVIVP